MNARPQGRLARFQIGEREQKFFPQLFLIVRPAIGQGPLCLRPNALTGVEFGRVRGEVFQTQAGMPTAQLANRLALVRAPVVPDHNHGARQMAQQMAQEVADLGLLDVFFMQLIKQTDVLALGTDREAADHRNALVLLMMAHHGRLAARRPSFAHRGDQEEPRLVEEDKIGAQPLGVFFIRGHCVRFHSSMAASLRSRARFSGFW